MVAVQIWYFDFSEYTLESLANAVNEQLAGIETQVPCGIGLGDVPPDSVVVTFRPGQGLDVMASSQLASVPVSRRNFLANRWLTDLIIFTRAFERTPDLAGVCQLWLGDEASHPGLTFCGNATGQVCIPDDIFVRSLGYIQARDTFGPSHGHGSKE